MCILQISLSLNNTSAVFEPFEDYGDPSKQTVARYEHNVILEQATRVNVLLAGNLDIIDFGGMLTRTTLEAVGMAVDFQASHAWNLIIFDQDGEMVPEPGIGVPVATNCASCKAGHSARGIG